LLVYLVLLLLFPMLLSIDQIWEGKTSRLWQTNLLTISWEENIKLKIPQIFNVNMKVGSFPSIENHIPSPSPTFLLLENVSERNRTITPPPPPPTLLRNGCKPPHTPFRVRFNRVNP
jgi:hypothetical protein